jgi:colanic acid/amylovoran biosynthesis protein
MPVLPRITIGLLWHSVNSGNLGVGALTVANIRLVREACAVAGRTPHFLVMGFTDPGRPAYVVADDIEFVPINTRAMIPFGAFDRAVRRCDLMIDIGGGDSWTDIYGPKRFTFLWWSKWRAMALGRPLIFAPQTIGPFSRPVQSRLAARIMARAANVVARDPASFAAATAMAPAARLTEAVDVAFALPSNPWPKADGKGGGKAVIGVNVSGLLFNRGYDGKSSFGMEIDYADYVRKLLTRLAERSDVTVRLISHVHSDAMPIDDDVRVAKRLAAEYPFVELVPAFADPVEAKSCIAALDFLVAARMHACIAAFSSGVAVLPVAYSRKFSGLFEGVLGYPHGVPVRGVTTDGAVAMTMDAIDRRGELAAATAPGRAKAQTRLADYRALLVQALGGARAS